MLKTWHNGNKKMEEMTVMDIWKNGWRCCEATRQPTECRGDEFNNLKTRPPDKTFITDDDLDRIAKTSFVPTADWDVEIKNK